MPQPDDAATAAGTQVDDPYGLNKPEGRYVKVEWRDDGQHKVTVVGIRRRAELERLLRAATKHAFACQMRGLPLDTPVTQRGKAGDADVLHERGE